MLDLQLFCNKNMVRMTIGWAFQHRGRNMYNNKPASTGLRNTIRRVRNLAVATCLLSFSIHAGSAFASASMDQKYIDLMAEPTNVQLLYDYAQEAIRQGEYESAVAVLEGLLVIARNQPQILLDLAALYKRLGAETIAESYAMRAQSLAEGDAELQSLAEFLTGNIREDKEKQSKAQSTKSGPSGPPVGGERH